MTLDDADDVNCVLFESAELPRHWPRLDHFEGPRYRRVVVEVRAEGRVVEAYVYELSGL
ncbi:gamma-glutamylcyclotransferase [Dermacoccus abyssi]|uniref:gamma-glutamylcyclotransferase n=1 Tax=Dermacoccus TaxID=57495 RepID=UPI0019D4B0FA